MKNTNTSAGNKEEGHKIVWSRYNSSMVKRIEVLLYTSFPDSREESLDTENRGKVGRPYEYPDEFFPFLSKMSVLWNVPFRMLEGIHKDALKDHRQIPSHELRGDIPSHKEHFSGRNGEGDK